MFMVLKEMQFLLENEIMCYFKGLHMQFSELYYKVYSVP